MITPGITLEPIDWAALERQLTVPTGFGMVVGSREVVNTQLLIRICVAIEEMNERQKMELASK